MICSMVPAIMIDTCWEEVSPLLEKACRLTEGRCEIDDVKAMLEKESAHLWVAYKVEHDKRIFFGAVVTRFNTYPRCRYLCLVFCGGVNLEKWRTQIMNMFRNFAKEMHCAGIEATARKGWSKLLAKDGYKARWVAFELPLSGV